MLYWSFLIKILENFYLLCNNTRYSIKIKTTTIYVVLGGYYDKSLW